MLGMVLYLIGIGPDVHTDLQHLFSCTHPCIATIFAHCPLQAALLHQIFFPVKSCSLGSFSGWTELMLLKFK